MGTQQPQQPVLLVQRVRKDLLPNDVIERLRDELAVLLVQVLKAEQTPEPANVDQSEVDDD